MGKRSARTLTVGYADGDMFALSNGLEYRYVYVTLNLNVPSQWFPHRIRVLRWFPRHRA